MKTVTLTVTHGTASESVTGTGPTVCTALADLHTKPRLRGYAIDSDNRYYADFCAELERTGKAQFGWGDYVLSEIPELDQPEPVAGDEVLRLRALVADAAAYLAAIDAMQPDRNHGTEGARIRAALAQVPIDPEVTRLRAQVGRLRDALRGMTEATQHVTRDTTDMPTESLDRLGKAWSLAREALAATEPNH